jgi:hypothetical protein
MTTDDFVLSEEMVAGPARSGSTSWVASRATTSSTT